MVDKEKTVPVTARPGVDAADIERVRELVARHWSLKDVLDWCMGQRPPVLDADVVVQDEFAHDFIVPAEAAAPPRVRHNVKWPCGGGRHLEPQAFSRSAPRSSARTRLEADAKLHHRRQRRARPRRLRSWRPVGSYRAGGAQRPVAALVRCRLTPPCSGRHPGDLSKVLASGVDQLWLRSAARPGGAAELIVR